MKTKVYLVMIVLGAMIASCKKEKLVETNYYQQFQMQDAGIKTDDNIKTKVIEKVPYVGASINDTIWLQDKNTGAYLVDALGNKIPKIKTINGITIVETVSVIMTYTAVETDIINSAKAEWTNLGAVVTAIVNDKQNYEVTFTCDYGRFTILNRIAEGQTLSPMQKLINRINALGTDLRSDKSRDAVIAAIMADIWPDVEKVTLQFFEEVYTNKWHK